MPIYARAPVFKHLNGLFSGFIFAAPLFRSRYHATFLECDHRCGHTAIDSVHRIDQFRQLRHGVVALVIPWRQGGAEEAMKTMPKSSELFVISDLHIGGKYSEKPGDRGFRINVHVDELTRFIQEVGARAQVTRCRTE